MKKKFIPIALILSMASLMPLQSCIGSFPLTNKVLGWNQQVGNKFVNELVFFAFWILPVYEVTSIADLLVINSIEFWSGTNPLDEASIKVVDTEQGQYLIASDEHGYTITTPAGEDIRLDFEDDTSTWTITAGELEDFPFMTFLDASHVRMIAPSGDYETVELSNRGVMAYSSLCQNHSIMAAR